MQATDSSLNSSRQSASRQFASRQSASQLSPQQGPEKEAYIEYSSSCPRDLPSRYWSIWDYLENNVSSTGVELSACNATGIVMSSMTFLNTVIYYSILMIVLISLLFFCYDYMLVISSPIETITVNLKNQTFSDNQTKQPIQPLPYEIQLAGNDLQDKVNATEYICGDKHQKWTETWMSQLGTPSHQYKDLGTITKTEQTQVIDNINCRKFFEKTQMCYVNPIANNNPVIDAIHGIQNSTFYNELPASRVYTRLTNPGPSNNQTVSYNHANNKPGMFSNDRCTGNTIQLNVIDADNNMCEKVTINDSSFNKTLTTVKRIYLGIVSICLWFLIISLMFNNYNYTLVENDMGWLNLFLVVYGVLMPMVVFFTLWKRPTLQYRVIDYVAGTTFHHKWKSKPYMMQTRDIVLTVTIVMVFLPIVIYMSTKSIARGFEFDPGKSQLSIDELLQFFVSHKKDPRNDGYVLKSVAFVVFMGIIGVMTVQFIKTVLSL